MNNNFPYDILEKYKNKEIFKYRIINILINKNIAFFNMYPEVLIFHFNDKFFLVYHTNCTESDPIEFYNFIKEKLDLYRHNIIINPYKNSLRVYFKALQIFNFLYEK